MKELFAAHVLEEIRLRAGTHSSINILIAIVRRKHDDAVIRIRSTKLKNCTEALAIQASVTISCSRTKLIKNGIALSRSLPALLKPCRYIKRGERVRVRGPAPFCATLH